MQADKKAAEAEKLDKEMSLCITLISELADHDESWPFINPGDYIE